MEMNQDIYIYTAIFGGRDSLKDPLGDLRGFRFVCFTDDVNLKSEIYEIRVVKPSQPDPVREARRYKILAHKFLPQHEHSIWVDANLKIYPEKLRALMQEFLLDRDLAVYTHPRRKCVYAEGSRCIEIKKDSPEPIERQLIQYRSENYPENHGLVMTSVLFRRTFSAQNQRFAEAWWQELCTFSRRDQMSFNYLAWKHGFHYSLIEQKIHRSEAFEFQPHLTSD